VRGGVGGACVGSAQPGDAEGEQGQVRAENGNSHSYVDGQQQSVPTRA
jgi:hypothetical protein